MKQKILLFISLCALPAPLVGCEKPPQLPTVDISDGELLGGGSFFDPTSSPKQFLEALLLAPDISFDLVSTQPNTSSSCPSGLSHGSSVRWSNVSSDPPQELIQELIKEIYHDLNGPDVKVLELIASLHGVEAVRRVVGDSLLMHYDPLFFVDTHPGDVSKLLPFCSESSLKDGVRRSVYNNAYEMVHALCSGGARPHNDDVNNAIEKVFKGSFCTQDECCVTSECDDNPWCYKKALETLKVLLSFTNADQEQKEEWKAFVRAKNMIALSSPDQRRAPWLDKVLGVVESAKRPSK